MLIKSGQIALVRVNLQQLQTYIAGFRIFLQTFQQQSFGFIQLAVGNVDIRFINHTDIVIRVSRIILQAQLHEILRERDRHETFAFLLEWIHDRVRPDTADLRNP